MEERQGNKKSPLSVFISYAHEDEPLRQRLEMHLSLLYRQGFILEWYDRDILPGAEWAREIDARLETASIILLLISADFLASDYCYGIELQRALERHQRRKARVIPIILRPCDWQTSPFAPLQCLPRDGKAVTVWQNPDEAFLDIVQGLRRIIERQQIPRHPLPDVERWNRMRLMKRVQATWIEAVLEHSLHQAALIALDLQEQPDTLSNPWQLVVQETNLPHRPLPAGTSVVQVYDETGGELLILGEPGAGKTTLLLELARTMLERATQEMSTPMPIVFNLSSWAVKRQPLANWLVEELRAKYQVPRKVSQSWINTDQVLPLLDGLDEVAENRRLECVLEINAYQQRRLEKGAAPLVVCCRSEDYKAISTRVSLEKAICIQPLTDEQIEHYLQSAKGQLEGLRHLLHTDANFASLARQPLMLSIATLAYQKERLVNLPSGNNLPSASNFPASASQDHLLRIVFADYVERMFSRRKDLPLWMKPSFLPWLSFLAKQLYQHQQSEFSLEDMQPDWLSGSPRRWYRLSTGLMLWLFGGLVLGVRIDEIQPVERLRWSWASVRKKLVSVLFSDDDLSEPFWLKIIALLLRGLGALIAILLVLLGCWLVFRWLSGPLGWWLVEMLRVGLLSKQSFGLLDGLLNWLLRGSLLIWLVFGSLCSLVAWPLAGLIAGLSKKQLPKQDHRTPNEGIWRSAKQGLFSSALGFGTVFVLFYWLAGASVPGLFWGLCLGLFAMLSFGLSYGLAPFLQHFFLRFLLWRSHKLPWNLVAFLDEAAERLLLRKVGGRYIFIHGLLRDYFASLDAPTVSYNNTANAGKASGSPDEGSS